MPTTAVVEVLDDNGLNSLFNRTKDATFKTTEFVQTVVKDVYGVGKYIELNFMAPINQESPNDDIDYLTPQKRLPDDLTML